MRATTNRRGPQRARGARTLLFGSCGLLSLLALLVGCASEPRVDFALERYWSGLGPVLPQDDFPGDCRLCHEGAGWHTLNEDFEFDHEAETGVPLRGAHEQAGCLRCHNDRGPVAMFAARGCVGCHEDFHTAELGQDCARCHSEHDWRPIGQVALHARTRFPLVGAHAVADCRRCHTGARYGDFVPTDTECLSCHSDDLLRTTNHVGLGWTSDCQRCHVPTFWEQAETDF